MRSEFCIDYIKHTLTNVSCYIGSLPSIQPIKPVIDGFPDMEGNFPLGVCTLVFCL